MENRQLVPIPRAEVVHRRRVPAGRVRGQTPAVARSALADFVEESSERAVELLRALEVG
jgi:hypothetical protein